MIKERNLVVRPWKEYELIDSGDHKKLERYGAYTLIRPETQALWKPSTPEAWKKADAEFVWAEGKGTWRKKRMQETWEFSWEDMRCMLRLTNFKHIGVFPEQAENWAWVRERIAHLEGAMDDRHKKPVRVLNLFGYTGAASIAAAMGGAEVTHVDASRQSNAWASENATLSEVPPGRIRYVLDDALKFAEREVRRGAEYEGIILDPPAFGRGAKGEVWRIEESLSKLLETTAKLLSKKDGSFFVLNGYASGYSPQSFLQAVAHFFPTAKVTGESGELWLKESGTAARHIPSGIYVRFVQ